MTQETIPGRAAAVFRGGSPHPDGREGEVRTCEASCRSLMPRNCRRRVPAGSSSRAIRLWQAADGVFATDACCPHLGFPLTHAALDGHQLRCGLHGATFDIRTGQGCCYDLTVYQTRLSDGRVWLGPPLGGWRQRLIRAIAPRRELPSASSARYRSLIRRTRRAFAGSGVKTRGRHESGGEVNSGLRMRSLLSDWSTPVSRAGVACPV